MLTEEEILQLQFHKLSAELLTEGDLQRSLTKVMESARKMLSFSRVVLYVIKKDLIEAKVAVGKYSFVAKSFRWPRNSMGGPSYVFRKGKAMIQKGLMDKRVVNYYPKRKMDKDVLFAIFNLAHLGKADIALAPIFSKGKVIGVLGADKLGKPIDEEDLNHLEDFASQAGWAIEKAELEQQNKALMKELEMLVEKRTRELQAIKEQLIHSERLAAMGELVAGVAHEIKNPLTGILGFTELMKNCKSHDEAKQLVTGLKTSVAHLQQVVKHFLSFAKKSKGTFRKISINQALKDAVALTSHQLKGMKVRIIEHLPDNTIYIKGDKNQLVQVFTNMFINSGQAMENEGGALTIDLSEHDHNAVIKIVDTGVGIPHDNVEKIFKPFFSTKNKKKGTGLGLSVTMGIIEKHCGMINVDSKEGKGTTFSIKLPIA